MQATHYFIQIVFATLISVCWLWAGLALYFSGPEPGWWRYCVLVVFIAILPAVYMLELAFWQRAITLIICFGIFITWWQSLEPSNNKDWATEVSLLPHGEIKENILTLHNVRDFHYRSKQDFDAKWETRKYDLNKLTSLDLYLSYWGAKHIAHVIMSWGFSDGQYLAISIETRKDKTQAYSSLKGFFKQFTLAYVASDETDLIKLRTHYRKEEVYRYQIQNISVEYQRFLLESYLQHMNKLKDHPEFYHALLQNCTAGISQHYKTFMPNKSWIDWRLIADGHLDKLLYDLKLIRNDLPFAQVREQARIDLKMQPYHGDNFSTYLRQ